MAQFPNDAISKQTASRLIQEAFSNREATFRAGEEYVHRRDATPSAGTSQQFHRGLQAQNQQLAEAVHQLQARICELEKSKSTSLTHFYHP